MNRLKFIFDKEKDLKNIWETANSKSKFMDFTKHMPKKLIEICKDKSFNECRIKLKKELKSLHESGKIEYYAEAVQKSWKIIEKDYFQRLEKITKKKLELKTVKVYVTTVGRCPYDGDNYSWFFVSYFSSIPMTLVTCGHEIMHFNFHKFFWKDIEKEIGKEKTNILKESLTVLLNFEFYELFFVSDRGYDFHQELRKFISEEWKKKKRFSEVAE